MTQAPPALPAAMRALVQGDGDTASVKTVPVPKMDDGDVLVKVDYAAQNPTDWKHVAYMSPPGSIIGCDYTGIVVAARGNTPDHLKVGTRVAGWVHGGMFPDRGSFAEYLHVPHDLCWPVPADCITPEQAAAYGIPYCTAFHGLVHSQKKGWPPQKENKWILIYGGSTSVGIYAVQIAKHMGYKVIAVCSARNFDLVKKYGADETVDYKDPAACIAEIKRITGGGVTVAMDCVSEASSQQIAVNCFGDKGGQLNVILPQDAIAAASRPDVKIEMTLVYTLFGKAFTFNARGAPPAPLPALPHEREWFAELCKRTPAFIEADHIRPPPLELRGGLEDINQGFEDMKAGKISAKRIVYQIA